MAEQKLLPCPFCGKPGRLYWPNDLVVCVHCDKCKAEGPLEATEKDAARKWNRRTSK